MKIINARELRNNQKKYLDMSLTEDIFVKRKDEEPIIISRADRMNAKIDIDPYVIENYESIKRGMDDIAKGRSITVKGEQGLKDFFDSL